MLYSETIREILNIQRYETFISVIKLIGYLDIFLTIYLFGVGSSDGELIISIGPEGLTLLSSMIIVGVLACIFLATSVYEINRFCKEAAG